MLSTPLLPVTTLSRHSTLTRPGHPEDLRNTMDPLLVDVEGFTASLLGNEAIVRGALEAGVAFASGYPGTPSSEVTDSFARIADEAGIVFEYSVNEKVALEMAFAASLSGARSICAMKHLGLMCAGDPISTIPYVGTVGGMVIVSAGDPSCRTSPNEQDQRHLGVMLNIPVLDPSTPEDAYSMARRAFDLSEHCRLPVLLRITTRVCHSRATVHYGEIRPPFVTGFVRDPQRYTPIPVNARRMRRELPGRLERAREWMSAAGLFRRNGSGRRAILASGAPAATTLDILRDEGLEDEVVLAVLGGVHPLPFDELRALLDEVDTVAVVEELSPFLEDALRAYCQRERIDVTILGKGTGHFPEEFEYLPATIRRGLRDALGLETGVPDPAVAASYDPVVPRPPSLCAGCPHRTTYFAARAAFGEERLYFNDIGCYTLGYGEPLGTVDALLCMGAGFSLAAGVARTTGEKTVGFVGDSTFFHSGMPPLLNAIKEDVDMVAVILDNQVTGMTGFQESPTVEVTETGDTLTRRVSIEAVVRALGAEHVETVRPSNLAETVAAFGRAREHVGVSVIIAEQPCSVFLSRATGAPARAAGHYRIDQSRCRTCGREAEGHRCRHGLTRGLERHLADTRARQVGEGGEGTYLHPPAPVAPCARACPLHPCIPGYAGHVAAGQFKEAYELIASTCALPDSVCRVCHRPCEEVCVRAEDGEPVAINDLKRFVADWAASQGGIELDVPREPANGLKVAVIGAGPAGLAAAHDLALRGYAVRLYDAGEHPGGLLRTGIPPFRLPRRALERDVERILRLGVTFRGNVVLGRDLSLDELLDEARNDAVLVAIGAHASTRLELPVADGAGPPPPVVDALEYLESALDGGSVPEGRRVVVIGGGNAAMDAARIALRRGAERVTVAYRRRVEELPALADELREARLEGVELLAQRRPLRLVPADPRRGAAGGVECVETRPGEPDASGRCRPVPVEGSAHLLEADLVIAAVGQWPRTEPLAVRGVPLATNGDGTLRADPETGATSAPRVFAAGDVMPGARTVTDAMAAGVRAAWGIDAHLRGGCAADRRPPPPIPSPVDPAERRARFHDLVRVPRHHPEELPPEERGGFAENVATLTEEAARGEAARCEVCGMCGNCRACLDLFGCPAFHLVDDRIEIDELLCTGCGICAAFCPNGAIVPAREEVES